MYLRRNSKTRSEVSFDEPLNIDWDGNELLLSDVLGTENDVIYRCIEDEVDKSLLASSEASIAGRSVSWSLDLGSPMVWRRRRRKLPTSSAFLSPTYPDWKTYNKEAKARDPENRVTAGISRQILNYRLSNESAGKERFFVGYKRLRSCQ